MALDTATATETIYRLLRPEEWERVAPVFAAHGLRLPSASLAFIAVAERDGQIIALTTLQPLLHVEPTWVATGHEADLSMPELSAQLEQAIRPALNGNGVDLCMVTDNAQAGRLAKACGFEHTAFHIWAKRVEPKED